MIDILTINKAQNYQLKVNVLQLGENFQAGGIIRKYAPGVILSRKYAPQGGYFFLGGRRFIIIQVSFSMNPNLLPNLVKTKVLDLSDM